MATGVGLRIKQRRKSLMLSQESLAKRMGLKSKSTICKIERGEDNLTTDTIAKYAEALHTSPAFLMGWIDDPNPRYIPREFDSMYPGVEEDDSEENSEDRLTSGIRRLISKYGVEEVDKAVTLFSLYLSAPPEIQTAVDTSLKVSQQQP